MSDLKAELRESIDEAEWEWLIPHVQRDAVILVAKELNLLDVAEAIANDRQQSVQQWIDEQLITKPSVDQLGQWNSDRQKRFNTLILQPFVLAQEITPSL